MDRKQLDDILTKHCDWLYEGKGGARADLSGADLSRADLSRADLSGADLYGADLYGANLYGADLSRADLYGANLSGADLSGANLYGANLSGANLSGADLSGANLYRADLSGANLSRANLYRADLSRADLSGANLSRADISETILDGINWLAYIGIVPDHQGTARAYKVVTQAGVGPFNGGINYLGDDTFTSTLDPDVSAQCSEGIHLATLHWCLDNKRASDNRLFMFSFNAKDAVCPIGSDGKFRVSKCRKLGECDWKGNLCRG